jgi:hypothetical protein
MKLKGMTERRVMGDDEREVTVVIKQLTQEQARQMYPYRPYNKYSESRFGGNTLVDDVALVLNGQAMRCSMCKAPTLLRYLKDAVCPDCDGRSEYSGTDPRAS